MQGRSTVGNRAASRGSRTLEQIAMTNNNNSSSTTEQRPLLFSSFDFVDEDASRGMQQGMYGAGNGQGRGREDCATVLAPGSSSGPQLSYNYSTSPSTQRPLNARPQSVKSNSSRGSRGRDETGAREWREGGRKGSGDRGRKREGVGRDEGRRRAMASSSVLTADGAILHTPLSLSQRSSPKREESARSSASKQSTRPRYHLATRERNPEDRRATNLSGVLACSFPLHGGGRGPHFVLLDAADKGLYVGTPAGLLPSSSSSSFALLLTAAISAGFAAGFPKKMEEALSLVNVLLTFMEAASTLCLVWRYCWLRKVRR